MMVEELSTRELAEELNDLQRGGEFQSRLISVGKSAVAALEDFMLRSPGNLRPRRLAAEALRVIGDPEAFDALVKSLFAFIEIDDPVMALEEEAVKNIIAAELRHFGRVAAAPLLKALEEQTLVAAGESLAELGEKRAIPYLVRMLEDSFKRPRVAEALLKFGPEATEELLKTIRNRKMENDFEPLPSIERRAEAAKLLGLIGDRRCVPALLEFLDDEQEPVRFETALSLLLLTREKAPQKATEVIKSSVNKLTFEKRSRAEEILCSMNTSKER
jgi:HEAT repeat protein